MSNIRARKFSPGDFTETKNDTSLTWLLGSAIAFVALVVFSMWYFDAHQELLHALEWVDSQGAWSAVWFISLMAAVVVFLIPGIFLTTGAGFVFGVLTGTLYVLVGTTIGASIAFLIARYLFGKRARRAILSNAKLRAISTETKGNDFQVVLLTRLIPFFPFKLSNYLFGLSEFSFWRYVAATFIGCMPLSLHNVYLGSLAADFASIGSGELSRTPLQWALYALGFAATIVALFYFSRVARRALAQA